MPRKREHTSPKDETSSTKLYNIALAGLIIIFAVGALYGVLLSNSGTTSIMSSSSEVPIENRMLKEDGETGAVDPLQKSEDEDEDEEGMPLIAREHKQGTWTHEGEDHRDHRFHIDEEADRSTGWVRDTEECIDRHPSIASQPCTPPHPYKPVIARLKRLKLSLLTGILTAPCGPRTPSASKPRNS